MAKITTSSLKPYKFKHITHVELEKNTNMHQRALSDASVDMPSSDSNLRSACETDCMAAGEANLKQNIEDSRDFSINLQHAISSSSSRMRINPYVGYVDKLKTDLDQLFIGLAQEIERLKEGINRINHEINIFKQTHHINRDPKIPGSLHKILAVFVILGLLTYETYFNGQIFADMLQGGAAAGQAMALGIAMINVFGSFLMGMALPLLWYKEISYRIWGGLIFSIYLILISFMNCLFGVYRTKLDSSSEMNEENFFTESGIIEVVGNPFTQLDILNQNGQMFILVGILFAIISLLDGLFFRDTYWGFGTLGEKKKKLVEQLSDKRKYVKNSYKSIATDCRDRIDIIETEYRENVEIWKSTMTLLQTFKSSYETLINKINGEVSSVLTEYCQLNAQARFTPSPDYFPTNEEPVSWKLDAGYEFKETYAELIDELAQMENFEQKATNRIDEIARMKETTLNEIEDVLVSGNERIERLL